MSHSHEKKRTRSDESFEEPRKKRHMSLKEGDRDQRVVDYDLDSAAVSPDNCAIETLENSVVNLADGKQYTQKKLKKKKEKKDKVAPLPSSVNVDDAERWSAQNPKRKMKKKKEKRLEKERKVRNGNAISEEIIDSIDIHNLSEFKSRKKNSQPQVPLNTETINIVELNTETSASDTSEESEANDKSKEKELGVAKRSRLSLKNKKRKRGQSFAEAATVVSSTKDLSESSKPGGADAEHTECDLAEPNGGIISPKRKRQRSAVEHNKADIPGGNLGNDGDKVEVKTISFKIAVNSHPSTARSNLIEDNRRLKEFRHCNKVSFASWQKVCDSLKKEGKKFTTGRFSVEEDEQLRKNWKKITAKCPFKEPHLLLMKSLCPEKKKDIEAYINSTDFYIKLGNHLNRPLYSVYIRARKLFHPGSYQGRYSKDEDEVLKRLFYQKGAHWQKIGRLMGRSGQSLCDRFKIIRFKHSAGPWTKEENNQLIAAVKSKVLDQSDLDGAYYNYPWTEIADMVPTRTAFQCRSQWIEGLAFGRVGKQKFNKLFQMQLVQEIMKLNVVHESEIDWIEMMSKFENVPSPQFLQNRWRNLRAKISDFERYSLNEVLEKLEQKLLCRNKKDKPKAKDDSFSDSEEDEQLEEEVRKLQRQYEYTRPRSFESSINSQPWRVHYPDIAKAVDWLRSNRTLFKNSVVEPDVVEMSEEEIFKVKARERKGYFSRHNVLKPTSFSFMNSCDFDLFIDKVRIDQNLRVNCEMLE